MLKMLLNDLLKDIDHYLIIKIELVLVYDDLLEINYLNLIQMMAMLNILEGIQLHLINQEDELEEKQIIRNLFQIFLLVKQLNQ